MKKITVVLLRGFQVFHPIIHQLNITVFGFSSTCRMKPSCSQYTIAQVQKHGTITGLRRGMLRVARCHTEHKILIP